MSSFTNPPDQSAPEQSGGGLGIRDYVLLALILLAIGGIAIMDFKPEWGFWYWIAMVPVFGALSIFLEWRSQMQSEKPRPVHMRAQLLHWLVTMGGIAMVFFIEAQAMSFERADTGMMALLILGLSTMYIGIHAEWRLMVVGLLLLATLGATVAAEQFFWVMLIPTVIAVWIIARRRNK